MGQTFRMPHNIRKIWRGALFEKKEVSYVKKLDINLGINTQKSVDAAVTVMCSKVKFRINWGESLPLCEPPEDIMKILHYSLL